MRKIVAALLLCTTLAIPVRSQVGSGIRQNRERSLISWFGMERILRKSIVAARPPCIAQCAREALWLCANFSKQAPELTSGLENVARRQFTWRSSRQARVEPPAP